ncbi:MAG: flavodoxin family protein [Porticoccaceae bacterium]
MDTKTLLIVAHMPSDNTRHLAEQVLAGASSDDAEQVHALLRTPFETSPDDVIACDAIILGTTENLGYMSGALKDFFDRVYYPCLEIKQGLPCALYIRAGHDGTGTRRAVETIVTGLKWNWIRPPLILKGEYQEDFAQQCRDLGELVAVSLDAGII